MFLCAKEFGSLFSTDFKRHKTIQLRHPANNRVSFFRKTAALKLSIDKEEKNNGKLINNIGINGCRNSANPSRCTKLCKWS
ncbi:hypothetical protein NCCP28_18000 [Niallia sp. NCCP-28]|nr:hypothetical protein NCCP28_18000 [Niallia sp. NCCP-28]